MTQKEIKNSKNEQRESNDTFSQLSNVLPLAQSSRWKAAHSLLLNNLFLKMRLTSLHRAVQKGGLDEAVIASVLGRGWGAISGLVSLILLTRFLSRPQQGFYFTFSDILGLQVFFELGLAQVLVQFASHERASLEWNAAGLLEGDIGAKVRLASLLRLIVRWYGMMTVLIIMLLLPGGLAYFSRYGHPYPNIAWQVPWTWIALVTAGTLALSPLLALLEGCGLIARIARMQMLLAIVGTVIFWVALRCRWGLYTAPITNTIAFLGTLGWLWLTKRRFFLDLWSCLSAPGAQNAVGIGWKQEIWPLQWKTALSWLSGYFIFRLFNPLMFAFHGAVAAGRLGLSLTIVAALSSISLAWITTKAAPFGMLVARREFEEMDRRFFPSMWQSFCVLTIGSVLIWLGTFALSVSRSPLSLRILDPLPMGLLLAATLVTHFVFCEAIYLRAHKQEPFLVMSLIWGSCILFSCLTLGKHFGATGMMGGYFVINLVVGLGGGTWIFVRKRALWHGENAAILKDA